MTNVLRRVSSLLSIRSFCRTGAGIALGVILAGAALVAAAPSASAQTENPALNKALAHFDLGVMGIGQFSNTTNGTNKQGQPLNTRPSTDFNAFGQIRFTASKYVGFEFNYVHGRYAYDFTTINQSPASKGTTLLLIVQTQAQEFSLGYVVHPHPTKYVKPFVGLGAGTIDFGPTKGGGEGLLAQGRAVYFYEVGGDAPITANFGLRAQFRQTFYLHPDYETNYLTDLKRNITSEPAVGFYLRF